MNNRLIVIGEKYNKLTILEYAGTYKEPSDKIRHKYKVQCDCGKVYTAKAPSINNTGSCIDCCFQARRKVQVGQRYDMVTVIDVVKIDKRIFAKVKCDCGKIYDIRTYNLPQNKVNNCGCTIFIDKTGQIFQSHFNRVERSAKERGLPFTITIQYVADLFEQQEQKCALTGLKLFSNTANGGGKTASLDRIDSDKSIGYIEGNVQWIHKDLNHMKLDFTQEEFINYCKLVAAKHS